MSATLTEKASNQADIQNPYQVLQSLSASDFCLLLALIRCRGSKKALFSLLMQSSDRMPKEQLDIALLEKIVRARLERIFREMKSKWSDAIEPYYGLIHPICSPSTTTNTSSRFGCVPEVALDAMSFRVPSSLESWQLSEALDLNEVLEKMTLCYAMFMIFYAHANYKKKAVANAIYSAGVGEPMNVNRMQYERVSGCYVLLEATVIELTKRQDKLMELLVCAFGSELSGLVQQKKCDSKSIEGDTKNNGALQTTSRPTNIGMESPYEILGSLSASDFQLLLCMMHFQADKKQCVKFLLDYYVKFYIEEQERRALGSKFDALSPMVEKLCANVEKQVKGYLQDYCIFIGCYLNCYGSPNGEHEAGKPGAFLEEQQALMKCHAKPSKDLLWQLSKTLDLNEYLLALSPLDAVSMVVYAACGFDVKTITQYMYDMESKEPSALQYHRVSTYFDLFRNQIIALGYRFGNRDELLSTWAEPFIGQ